MELMGVEGREREEADRLLRQFGVERAQVGD
jgi:hypothetical protein